MKSIISILLLFILPLSIYGQSDTVKILSTSGLVDGSHIKPYSNKWRVYGIDEKGNETLQTIWTDYVQTIKMDGKQLISRTQELYSPELNLQEVWTNLFEQKTMLPLRASQLRTNGTFLYQEFDGPQVKVRQKLEGKEVTEVLHNYEVSPYDWTLYGVLLSALPLKVDWTGSIPTLNAQDQSKAAWLNVHVASKETLTTEDGRKFTTLKVVTDRGLVFWLAKKAPYVIQLELQPTPKQKILWRMY